MNRLSELIGITPPALSPARAVEVLTRGRLDLLGQLPWSSNTTLLVSARLDEQTAYAIYKPRRGERPLWDFPAGTLCQREVAAYVVSEALGWGLVPPTVLRRGPLGMGAVQLFVDHDPQAHYLTLAAPDPSTVQRLVAFDLAINNADRKSGHVLEDPAGRLWAIDHGIAFHAEPKLRTVIWDYAGLPIERPIHTDLTGLAACLADPGSTLTQTLGELLSPAELRAIRRRIQSATDAGTYPDTDPRRREIPWPPV